MNGPLDSLQRVACVIVTYNSCDVVGTCLNRLAEQEHVVEIVVVDNASADATREVVAAAQNRSNLVGSMEIRLIANANNRGFAAAVNQGFVATSAELVLILNPDVTVIDPLIPVMAACQEYGLAAGRLVDAQGRTQAGFTIRRFPTATVLAFELLGLNRLLPGNRWNRQYRYLDWMSSDGVATVDQPAGAFLMVRRDVWEKLAGWDEEFWPVWFEDVDFCKRAKQFGFQACYIAGVRAGHLGGHSIKKIDGASRELYWYDSLLRYAAKHFPTLHYRVICVAAVVSAVPRMGLNALREHSLEPVLNGFRIIYLSGKRLVSAKQQVSRL
ncbi:MAG: glycosyltransferase family 2 protein [Acidobacteriota bacterium]